VIACPAGAKIFRVHPVEFYVNNEVLYIKDSDGEAPIAFDVAAFEIAYMRRRLNCLETRTTKKVDNPQAIYIYHCVKN
jgi:hypothetical protein